MGPKIPLVSLYNILDDSFRFAQYVVVNEDFEESVAKVEAILNAERLKRARQAGLVDFVIRLRQGQ